MNTAAGQSAFLQMIRMTEPAAHRRLNVLLHVGKYDYETPVHDTFITYPTFKSVGL